MTNIKNKILLIAFKYPPYAGVGGFRWSKLSKYLARLGHELHVVTVKWTNNGPNTLLDDVQHKNIRIHEIPSGYPHNVKAHRTSNKYLRYLKSKVFSFIDRYIYWDDEAQYWGRFLIPYCSTLIKREKIKIVIATGHPFEANYWAACLRETFPLLKLIQDFRDPWLINPATDHRHGCKASKVKQREKYAVEKADYIVSVTNGLVRYYGSVCDLKSSEFHLIRNGYDPETITTTENSDSESRLENVFRFVHVGNITNNRDVVCDKFLAAISSISEKIKVRLHFAGVIPAGLLKKYDQLVKKGIFNYNGVVSHPAAMDLIKNADFALHFNAKSIPYSLSTKIYEYIALRIPVVSLNYGGEIEEMINNKKFGVSINIERDDVEKKLINIINSGQKYSFSCEEYSYMELAKKYSELITKAAGN